jgi:hypothetical protein
MERLATSEPLMVAPGRLGPAEFALLQAAGNDAAAAASRSNRVSRRVWSTSTFRKRPHDDGTHQLLQTAFRGPGP